jgi:hypothetical protein
MLQSKKSNEVEKSRLFGWIFGLVKVEANALVEQK